MQLIWTSKAGADLERIRRFLHAVNPPAASERGRAIRIRVRKLLNAPRMGERLLQYEPDEVRRIYIIDYEVRYRVEDEQIHIVRVWHTREQR